MVLQFKQFKKLELSDKEEIDKFTSKFPTYSDFNFVSLYSYNVNNECEICYLNDNLVIKFNDYITEKPFLSFLGNNAIEDTINTLLKYSKELGMDEILRLVPEISVKTDIDKLQSLYEITEDMDSFDYILSAEDMKTLEGSKFKSKRNRIQKFKDICPEHDVTELDLADPNVHKEIYDLFAKWAQKKNKTSEETNVEYTAIQRLLDSAHLLNLVAVGIYHKCELIGFTINEVIHDEHYMAHFGKIDETYPGLFQYLEHITAVQMGKYGCRFMNFQQDLGIPGLRESKREWHPVKFLKKYTIKHKTKETVSDIIPENIAEAIYKRNMKLLEERRHAEDLLYNVSEGVLSVDKSYRIVLFNHALESMLEIPENEAIGKDLRDLIKVETQKKVPIDLTKYCFQDKKEPDGIFDAVLKTANKEYFVNINFSLIPSENKKEEFECLITISDITKEILLDKAKDDFISLASHELRTPMTVIKSYLWMLQKNSPNTLTEKQIEYLSKTIKSTNELINLINDMLNISRMEEGRLSFNIESFELNAIIDEAISGFDLKAKEKNIYLNTDYTNVDKKLNIRVDSGKFKEIIVNLVGNAIKFTKTGGVTVKIEPADTKLLKISIIDTGAGISIEESKKLFQKFGRGEGAYDRVSESGGSGLGLYIVKIYIEAMKGNVGFHSEGPGKGSTFWITVATE